MLSRRGQLLSRLPARPSLAGDGLLERMRSTAFALLGVTAAMGLGLVALVSQSGWPALPFAPIPGPPAGHGAVHEATAVTPPRAAPGDLAPGPEGGAGARREGGAAAPGGATAPPGSRLAGSRQVAGHPSPPAAAGGEPSGGRDSQPVPAGQPAAGSAPAPTPSGQPTAAPVPPSAPATPPVAVSPPPAQVPVAFSAGSHGKGNAYGRDKATSGPRGKARPAPPPAASPVAPPTPPAEDPAGSPGQGESPPPDGTPEAPGNGHGHAYGHDRG